MQAYEAAHGTWPSRYSECGWIAAALIAAVAGESNVREALKNALPRIKAPRGPMRFDAYRQAITPIDITRTEDRQGRIVNVVIDAIAGVTQESTWGWWNRG